MLLPLPCVSCSLPCALFSACSYEVSLWNLEHQPVAVLLGPQLTQAFCPADGQAVQELRTYCARAGDDFFDNPRNVLLAVFIDGICPFNTGTHSLTVIFGMVLNWPPHVRGWNLLPAAAVSGSRAGIHCRAWLAFLPRSPYPTLAAIPCPRSKCRCAPKQTICCFWASLTGRRSPRTCNCT